MSRTTPCVYIFASVDPGLSQAIRKPLERMFGRIVVITAPSCCPDHPDPDGDGALLREAFLYADHIVTHWSADRTMAACAVADPARDCTIYFLGSAITLRNGGGL